MGVEPILSQLMRLACYHYTTPQQKMVDRARLERAKSRRDGWFTASSNCRYTTHPKWRLVLESNQRSLFCRRLTYRLSNGPKMRNVCIHYTTHQLGAFLHRRPNGTTLLNVTGVEPASHSYSLVATALPVFKNQRIHHRNGAG